MGNIIAKFVPFVVISTSEVPADEREFHVKSEWRVSEVAEVPENFAVKKLPASTQRSQ